MTKKITRSYKVRSDVAQRFETMVETITGTAPDVDNGDVVAAAMLTFLALDAEAKAKAVLEAKGHGLLEAIVQGLGGSSERAERVAAANVAEAKRSTRRQKKHPG